jgi:UDPglucose 6-dehydrogenase
LPTIKKHFNGSLKGKTIAFWGLSFKPQTDDIREAPAIVNIKALLSEGVNINAHDPEAMINVKRIFNGELKYCDSPYDATSGADALFIATEWAQFRTPDFDKLSTSMKSKVIFDGRNLYNTSTMKDLGYTYYSIGRGNAHA